MAGVRVSLQVGNHLNVGQAIPIAGHLAVLDEAAAAVTRWRALSCTAMR